MTTAEKLSGAEFHLEFHWLSQRFQTLLGNDHYELPAFTLPELPPGPYKQYIEEQHLSQADRVVLITALMSALRPAAYAVLLRRFRNPEIQPWFGGRVYDETGHLSPTLRTAIFALAGFNDTLTAHYLYCYTRHHSLFSSGLLTTPSQTQALYFADSELMLNEQFLPTLLHGHEPLLDGDAGFPARRGKKQHTLTDVVLDEETMQKLQKLSRFASYMQQLWKLPQGWKYRQNYICIFSGDPGTGKSHTAEAIGNELGLPVYKVNFAQLASKYIGETEKNLERIFDRFSGKPGILFFDEAEAVFSKRIEVKDSHDKHANNEQSFLLQKIEEFSGIVILATNVQNLSQYFDKAFQRRIRQVIPFSFPDYPERLRIWQNALATPFQWEPDLPERLAKNYQFSGGSIYNVVSDAIVEALARNTHTITFDLLEKPMQEEFQKTGRKYETCTDEQLGMNFFRRYGPGYEQRKNF
jgi:AAA+ superfamily predicted ATPase